ncbi:venom carboxylesterase-6-like isoform X2 [Anoplophora glabripennis]|uniref:venom carboxylesterase-6-like isoform X2 n=1 Tax=Anoplophora glabripennis TaxID=217634 RepID=UPI000C769B47|nr:venom carboxylesterase-6-like isoform X2 [Anoplophora glabripennis]
MYVGLDTSYPQNLTSKKCLPSKNIRNKLGTLQVKTNNGFVQGFSRKMGNGKDIFIYQGIPFAKPPLYNLRFMSPQPQTKWAGVLDARQQTQPCVQLMFRTTPITVNGVEDCLYLNTYSPIKPRSNETVPVLYWIQGGSFLEGDVTIYDPEYFVEENVIVVTANYRLGMFGFLSTEDEAAPGNYALKDQNAVLRWIRSNIKGFGGDPNRVTILGQSAGACSVMYHMVSPKSIGLFHGAIAMSGNSLSPWCLQRYPRNVARDISLHLGLSIENSTAFVEALRKMDSQQLMYGQVVPILVNLAQIYHNGLAFTPVIEYNHKDAFVTESSYSLLEKGKFAKVPLIIGTTSMEFILFKNIISLIRPLLFVFDLSPGLIPSGMNIPSFSLRRIVGNKIRNRYFQAKSVFAATYDELLQYLSDVFFITSMQKSVELITRYSPAYMYVFDYEGQIAIESLSLLNYHIARDVKGAGHAEDMVYLWKGLDMNRKERLVQNRLTKIWTNFIKYGNPTPIMDELLQNVTWPSITTPDSAIYLHIGESLTLRQDYRGSYKKFWADLFEKYCQKPFYIY